MSAGAKTWTCQLLCMWFYRPTYSVWSVLQSLPYFHGLHWAFVRTGCLFPQNLLWVPLFQNSSFSSQPTRLETITYRFESTKQCFSNFNIQASNILEVRLKCRFWLGVMVVVGVVVGAEILHFQQHPSNAPIRTGWSATLVLLCALSP